MARQDPHEFHGETPVASQKDYRTGEHVPEDAAYACANCGEWKEAPMVNLLKGDMVPPCGKCGPNSRWVKI
jgi:hypothetical protein